MKVAIIIPRLEQVGPVKVIQALVNSLCNIEDLHITVFHLDKVVDPQVKMLVPVAKLERGKFCFDDYEIIHTNGIRPDFFAFINRKKIKYHISTIHNFVFEDLGFTYNKLISLIFANIWLMLWKRADKLVCVSHSMKKYYAKWHHLSKLEVIHNGIAEPDNSFVPDYEIIKGINDFHSRGLTVIGTVGKLTKRKGIEQVLYLVGEETNIALLIFGDGKELTNLINLAHELKISDRCFFCGFRSSASNYFRYFDFFILPSRSEGFGLTLIEAVQQKVRPICSELEVFKELLSRDEVTFFKLDDLDSLKDALKEAIKNGYTKTDLAYLRYKNNYTDQIMAKKYFELYKQA